MQNRGAMSPQSDEEREMDAMANQIRAKRQITTPAVKEEAPMASPEQLAYNRLRAQHDGYQAMTSGGGNTAVSRDPAHAAKLATVPAELARMAAALKAKGIDAEAEYDAIGGPRSAPVDANQVYGGVAEGSDQQLSIRQLATISDEALDKAYGYGRSTPGNTFGWQANLKSAAYAKHMIDKGVTDIDEIADAIHKGWNVTARAFVKNPDRFDDTEKLKAAGKLEAKLQQRAKLMNIGYAQLPDDEQEKDRVVARALLQAITGSSEQGVAEGNLKEFAPGGNSASSYYAVTANFVNDFAQQKQEELQDLIDAGWTKQDLAQAGTLQSQAADIVHFEQVRDGFLKGLKPGFDAYLQGDTQLKDQLGSYWEENDLPLNQDWEKIYGEPWGRDEYDEGVAEGSLNELSVNTLSSYGKKAEKSNDNKLGKAADHTKKATDLYAKGTASAVAKSFDHEDQANKLHKQVNKRDAGMDQAAAKLGSKFKKGVAEGSDRVDSLVTDALKIMRGPEMSDAVLALKRVLGDRAYNERRGFYSFYVDKIHHMYGQQGVAESNTLMKKLHQALLQEGRVKELADDLKTLNDAEFMKKYGKAKAAIRRDMKKVDEGNANSGRRGPNSPPDNTPVKLGRVQKLKTGIKHHADSSRYGGTVPDTDDDHLLSPASRHRLHKAVTPDKQDMDEGQLNELSTSKLAQYKTAAAADAKKADQAGDVKRGDKRFGGIVKATKKQFDNDAKKIDESRAARQALMAQIANSR
jgi:hypothetical protein